MERRVMRVAGAAAAVALLAAGAVGMARSTGTDDERDQQGPGPAPAVAFEAERGTTLSPERAPSPGPGCRPGRRAFTPTAIAVPGVTGGAAVVTPPRDSYGVPGVPPLTTAGKAVFAWDTEQGVRPGDPAGNVLLNAHTWPDGTALGNRLLAGLHRGDRIEVRGGRARLCYRVTERIEVLAETKMPRYYDTEGPPQLALIVCSGRRLGPGLWEKRTIWFASPVGA